MKADLINGTWKQWSTWNGKVYEKYSPEEYGGVVRQVKSAFRVYDSYRQCMEDYAAFLLHVRNDKGLKYACIEGWTDPAKVIHRIRIGTGTDAHPEGYATDSGYEKKVLNLISKYNLTQYDGIAPIPVPTPAPEKKTMYRVQVEADRKKEQAEETAANIYHRTQHECFLEQGGGWWRVFCGSFKDKAKAEARRQEIIEACKKDKRFQSAFIKEVEV